jgi:chromosome segregation ATPase
LRSANAKPRRELQTGTGLLSYAFDSSSEERRSMKWIGWVIFIITLMACFAISTSNKDKLAKQQLEAENYLEAERTEVERMLANQSGRNASFEKKLADEEKKLPPLQAEFKELEARKKELSTKIEKTDDSIASLKDKLADAKSAAKNSQGTSEEAKRRIANAEKEIEIIKRAIPSVRVQ